MLVYASIRSNGAYSIFPYTSGTISIGRRRRQSVNFCFKPILQCFRFTNWTQLFSPFRQINTSASVCVSVLILFYFFFFDSHLAFMKDYKFNYSLYFISIFPLEPINALASIASKKTAIQRETERERERNGFPITSNASQHRRETIYVASCSLLYKKKVLRQSIVYWLEVSTWEFSFSLDFHFFFLSLVFCLLQRKCIIVIFALGNIENRKKKNNNLYRIKTDEWKRDRAERSKKKKYMNKQRVTITKFQKIELKLR